MKKIAMAVLAATMLITVTAAQGGAKMQSHKMVAHPAMHTMTVAECCMQGLSASEKTMAMGMMKNATPAQHEAMMKRCSMCMKDPHTALKHMDMGKVTEKMKMDHMMSGMSKSEQKTMMAMMSKMSPAQKALCEKMCMNCCMYGMAHAGHK